MLFGQPSVFNGLLQLFLFIPNLAILFRRIHDIDRSAWYLLLGLIPLVGFIIIYWWFVPGTAGTNRFGSDPLRELPAVTA